MNIPLYGMVGIGWLKCARLLPLTPLFQGLLVENQFTPAAQYWTVQPGELPVYQGFFPKLSPHFPWGYNVEPDSE